MKKLKLIPSKWLSSKRNISIFVLVLVMIIAGGYLVLAKVKGLYPFSKNSIVAADTAVEPLVLTEDQLSKYAETYKDPYVVAIRTILDDYLAGRAPTKGTDIYQTAIKAMVDDEGMTNGLDSFSKDYYKSKFVVDSYTDGYMGGKWISIQFQDKPDAIFDIWMYQTGNYEMRGFEKELKTDAEIRDINARFANFLKDKVNAL